MKQITLPLSMLCALLFTACATTYDPAEVCSADWIKPRAEDALDDIEKDTARVIINLRKVAASYVEGKSPNFFEMLSLRRSVDRLEDEFENGRGVRDLRMLARTCDDPDLVADALGSFMRDQGLPERLVAFIESLDRFRKITAPDFDAPQRTSLRLDLPEKDNKSAS